MRPSQPTGTGKLRREDDRGPRFGVTVAAIKGQVEEGELIGGQGQAYLGDVDGIEPGQLISRADVLSETDPFLPHPPGKWCTPFAAAVLQAGFRQIGFRRLQLGAGFRELRLAQGQGRRPAFAQRLPFAEGLLGLGFFHGDLPLGLRDPRLGFCHGVVVVARIDCHQHLARFEKAAGDEPWMEPNHLARHLRH